MIDARRHRHDIAATHDGHRCFLFGLGPVAQLAVVIVAHGPQRAIVLHKQGMIVSRRRRHHIAGHRFRPMPVCGGPVAQLAVAVAAPRQQLRGADRHRHGITNAHAIHVGYRHVIDTRVRHARTGDVQRAVGRAHYHSPVFEPLVSQWRVSPRRRNAQIHGSAGRHGLVGWLCRDGWRSDNTGNT